MKFDRMRYMVSCLVICCLMTVGACGQDEGQSTPSASTSTTSAGDQVGAEQGNPVVGDDPSAMEVEFDTEGLEDFDSADFDLSEIDPEADIAMARRMRIIVGVAIFAFVACIVVAVLLRKRRSRRT